jgi:hypothetical protein
LTSILNLLKAHKYAISLFISVFLLSALFLRVHQLFLNDDLAYSGGDFTFEIFITKLAIDGNFLGISSNVGWPGGFAVWANPAYGFGPYYLSLLLGSIFGSLNVYQIYFLVLAFALALNSLTGYWMVGREFASKFPPLLLGIIIGLTPFGFLRVGHMPVAWFYFPLLVIGVIFRLNRKQLRKIGAFLILAIGGIFSPLWWTLATLLVALVVFLTTLFKKKNFMFDVGNWSTILAGTVASITPTFLLMVIGRNYNGEGSRFPWQSDVFGGRFLDVALSSPFLNNKYFLIEKLAEGTSPEARTSFMGFVLGASIAILIVYLINEASYNLDVPSDFRKLSLVVLLFFIVGGLGNLQAGAFVLIDQVSPARVWFRLGIILGILGFFVLLKFMDSSQLSKSVKVFASIIVIAISLLDLKFTEQKQFIKKSDLIQFSPTQFLNANTDSCPVLQVPIDTYPLMQDFLSNNGDKFLYPQMIPYTLGSRNKWSLVATPNNAYWKNYTELPIEINLENVKELENKGFCAILFDKDFSLWQIERKAGLNFTQGSWPGLQVNLPKVDFENERYQVYLLKNN